MRRLKKIPTRAKTNHLLMDQPCREPELIEPKNETGSSEISLSASPNLLQNRISPLRKRARVRSLESDDGALGATKNALVLFRVQMVLILMVVVGCLQRSGGG